MTDTNSLPAGRQAQKIDEILTRGVENIFPNRDLFEQLLKTGRKIRIYHGIDPTGKLHVGHMVAFRKLRQFQDMGHEIIILFGGFTATIGDPTDKKATRQPLTRKQVLVNAKDYKKQIGKILDLRKSNIRFLNNEKWTNKLKPADLFELASRFTVARLLERDMFQERIKAGKDISASEFLYPVLQAYDSVTMDVDVEIGGNDQTFNMLAGRDLMKKMRNKEKFVLATKLLVDPTGKKMGKTEGNMVNLDENADQMFGKIMSWPDGVITLGLEILTDIPMSEIVQDAKAISEGTANPKDIKIKLAKNIISVFHGEKEAEKAEEEFNKIHRDRELPSDMPVFETDKGNYFIADLLCDTKLSVSKNEAKRLVEGGGVETIIGDKKERVTDWRKEIILEDGMIIKVGSRKFVKIVLK